MGVRGRPSAASIVAKAAMLEKLPRIRPPHELNDEETEVWAYVTDSFAADWFLPANAPLLAQYCRHVVQAKRIAELIERSYANEVMGIDEINKLLAIQERESRAIALMATKLRITPQSTTNARGNARVKASSRPWELDNDE